MMETEDFERHGLYDPAMLNASDRLALLQFNVEHGIGLDEMLEAQRSGRLAYVVADPIIRGEGPRLTISEAAERSGLLKEQVARMWRAAGFAEPGPEDRPFSETDLEVLPVLATAEDLFGTDVTLQLVRVMGSAMARVAEAEITAFGVQVSGQASSEGWTELDVARLHVDVLGPLLSQVAKALDMLHRRHLEIVSQRLAPNPFEEGADRRHLAVGFADLCGFTTLSGAMTPQDLSRAVAMFDAEASDLVTGEGGRVVKLIGDEVMFVAPDLESGCDIAFRLIGAFAAHPVLPPLKASVAAGEAVLFEGDYFGTVVNLAARLVALAESGEVVVPADGSEALESKWRVRTLGPRDLKGFADPVGIATLESRDGGEN
jgi:class 3 adenylate cyclase